MQVRVILQEVYILIYISMASFEEYLKCLISFQDEVSKRIMSNEYDGKSYLENIQKMANYVNTILKRKYDKGIDMTTKNLLKSVCINYIYIVLRFYTEETSKNYISRCYEFLEVLFAIIEKAPDKTILFERIGNTLFQFLQENFLPNPVKNEIIKYFNMMLRKFKPKYSHEDFLSHLCKLMDYVSICGDFDIQELSIELILRICPITNEIETAKQFFPESEDFAQLLTTIHKDEKFEENTRLFLNSLNNIYGKVTSLKAHEVYIEQRRVIPHQSFSDVWVDFNFGSQSIGIHCSSKSFSQNPKESDEEFEVIKIKEEQIESIDVSFNKTTTSNNCEIAIQLLESVTTLLKSSKKFADSVKLLKILFEQVPDGCNLNEYFSTLFPKKYTLKGLSSNDCHDSSNTGLLESNIMPTIGNILQKSIPDVNKDDLCSNKDKRQLGFKSHLNYSMVNDIKTDEKSNQSKIVSLHSSPDESEDDLCSKKDKRQLGFKSRLDYSIFNKIETDEKSNQSKIVSLHSSPDESEDDLCSKKDKRQLGLKSRLDYSIFNKIETDEKSNQSNIVSLHSSPDESEDDLCSKKDKRQLGFKSRLDYSIFNKIETDEKSNQSKIVSLHSSPDESEDDLCSKKDRRQLGFKSRLDYSMFNKIETDEKSNQNKIVSLHSSADESEDDLCSKKDKRQLGFKSRLDYSMFNNIGTYKESNQNNIVPLCSSPASSTHLKSPASDNANSIGSSMKNNVGGTYGISHSISENLLNSNTFENSPKPNDNDNKTSLPQISNINEKLFQEFDNLNKENIEKFTRNTKPKNLNKVKSKTEQRKREVNSELETFDILAKSKQNNNDVVEKRKGDNYVTEYKETNINGIQDNLFSNTDQTKSNKLTNKAKSESKLLLNKQLSSLSCINSEIVSQESPKKFDSNTSITNTGIPVSLADNKIISNRNNNVLTELTNNKLKLGLSKKKINSSQKKTDSNAIPNTRNDDSQNEFKYHSLSVPDSNIISNKNKNVSTKSLKNTCKLGLTKKKMKPKKNNSKLKDLNGKDHNNSSKEVKVIKPIELDSFKPQSLLKLEECPSEKSMLQDNVKSSKKNPVEVQGHVLINDGRSIKRRNVSKGNISSTSKKRILTLRTDFENSVHKTSVTTEPKISSSQDISVKKVISEPRSNLISIYDFSTIPENTICDIKYKPFIEEMRSKRRRRDPAQNLESTNFVNNNSSLDNTDRAQGINDNLIEYNKGSQQPNFKLESKSNLASTYFDEKIKHKEDDVQDDSDQFEFPINKMIQKNNNNEFEDNEDGNSSDNEIIKPKRLNRLNNFQSDSEDFLSEKNMLQDYVDSTNNHSVELPQNILSNDGKPSSSLSNDIINLTTNKRRFIPHTYSYSSDSSINTIKPKPTPFPDESSKEDNSKPQSNIIKSNHIGKVSENMNSDKCDTFVREVRSNRRENIPAQNFGSSSNSFAFNSNFRRESRTRAINDFIQKSNRSYLNLKGAMKAEIKARKELMEYYAKNTS